MADDLKSQMSELMKKVILTGVGTVFMTEEAIRNLMGELKLPKEIWNGLIESASKQKSEFFTMFAKEATTVFSKIDIAQVLDHFFEKQSVKISIEIKTMPKRKKEKAD